MGIYNILKHYLAYVIQTIPCHFGKKQGVVN